MTFHIIYTPHSTQYLIHFIPSLLKYTTYNFCLVSNGCLPKERAILKKLSETNERLNYYCFPTNQMQIHGKVVTHLQAKCLEEYFCFMDSDIFSTALFPDLKQTMEKENLTGLFAGMPLWVKESEYTFKPSFKGMLGTFNKMEDSTCIGSTYFAIYKNENLNQIIQHYGVSFDECLRFSLPIDIQQELQQLGYSQNSFDTGKVINLILNKHSFDLKNIEIPELCHIGGTSYETTNQNQRRTSKKQQLKKWLLKGLFKRVLLRYLEGRKERTLKARYTDTSFEEYQINYNQRGLHRGYTRQHFLKLFLALKDNQSLPTAPTFKDIEITRKVAQAHKSYIQNFKNYYN